MMSPLLSITFLKHLQDGNIAHEQKKMDMILGSPRRLAPAFYVYKMGVWTPHSYWNGDEKSKTLQCNHNPKTTREVRKATVSV